MCIASGAKAGIWVSDPVVGLDAEYSTNPALLDIPHTGETHGAALVDLPTSFIADAMHLTIQPSFRVSDSSGYSSLASNYAHLTVVGEVDHERDSFNVTGQAARDSSLYYNYGFNGSTGVRRDTTLVDAVWKRSLTERLTFSLDFNSSRVQYGTSDNHTVLTDYRYTSTNPTLSWNVDALTSLSVIGGGSLYTSLDGTTRSVDESLALGLTRALSELWTLTGNAGESRETDRISAFGRTFQSTVTGNVFSLTLARQGQLLSTSAVASRTLAPVGLAFLSKQDSYQINFGYPTSDRWTFNGSVRRLNVQTPQVFGSPFDQTYLIVQLSAAWQVSERWTATLLASRATYKFGQPAINVGATGATLQMSYHFNRINWH